MIAPEQQPPLIAGRGTPAAQWAGWPGWPAVPTVTAADLVPPGARLVVLAPHPDDEVLGCGGLMLQCAQLGRPVLLVAVTDGGASHPGSTRWPVQALLAARPAETQAALAVLGVPAQLHRCRIADGDVTDRIADLDTQLAGLLAPGDVVATPWHRDGHPDHEAVSDAGRRSAAAAGLDVLEVPIWGWHWTHPPSASEPRAPAVLPLDQAVQLPLGAALAKKTQAVRGFDSQLQPDPSTGAEPVLAQWALDRWLTGREVYFRLRPGSGAAGS